MAQSPAIPNFTLNARVGVVTSPTVGTCTDRAMANPPERREFAEAFQPQLPGGILSPGPTEHMPRSLLLSLPKRSSSQPWSRASNASCVEQGPRLDSACLSSPGFSQYRDSTVLGSHCLHVNNCPFARRHKSLSSVVVWGETLCRQCKEITHSVDLVST